MNMSCSTGVCRKAWIYSGPTLNWYCLLEEHQKTLLLPWDQEQEEDGLAQELEWPFLFKGKAPALDTCK
jgi:hypothetical protein